MNQYKLDGWKLEIRDKVFTLDKKSETDQGVKKILDAENAGNYEQKLEAWIKYFAVGSLHGIYTSSGMYQYIPDTDQSDYYLLLNINPLDPDHRELLAQHISNLELDYKIRISLLFAYTPRNHEQFKFHNDHYIQCLENGMMTDYRLARYLRIKRKYIKTYDQMRVDIETRIKTAPIGKDEFCQNELDRILDDIENINRIDSPGIRVPEKDSLATRMYLCPNGWHPENFLFKNLVQSELRKIKAGIPFAPDGKKINWNYNGDGTGYIHHRYFWKIILANAYARIIFDLERMMKEPPDDQKKTAKPKEETSYRWRSNQVKELPEMYEKMKGTLIAPETTLDQFRAIFTGQPIESIEPIEWIVEKNLLAFFIDVITDEKRIDKCHHWAIGSKAFKKDGEKITSAQLRSARNNYMNNYKSNKEPKDSHIINDLISSLYTLDSQ